MSKHIIKSFETSFASKNQPVSLTVHTCPALKGLISKKKKQKPRGKQRTKEKRAAYNKANENIALQTTKTIECTYMGVVCACMYLCVCVLYCTFINNQRTRVFQS